MRINIKKLKAIPFILVFIAVFGISHQAHADDTYSSPANNGLIWAIVNVTPASMSTNATFTATGKLTSASSTSEVVNLTANNNGNGEVPLVPLTAGTINLGIGASSALNQITFTAPGVSSTYNVTFTTYVDIVPPVVQNYSYLSSDPNAMWGAVFGKCTIGNPTQLTLSRDEATRLNAIARGVTHVVVTYPVFVDGTYGNTVYGGGLYVRFLVGDFYPNDTEIPANFNDGGDSSDFNKAGACAGLAFEGYYFSYYFNAQEYF